MGFEFDIFDEYEYDYEYEYESWQIEEDMLGKEFIGRQIDRLQLRVLPGQEDEENLIYQTPMYF